MKKHFEIYPIIQKISWTLIFVFGLISLFAETPINTTFNEANEAYKNKDYEKAESLYSSLLSTRDPKVYFNLGNCYFRKKQFDKAILYYEKALKWGGNQNDIEHNLNRSREFLKDELKSAPELVVWQFWKRAAVKKSANTWSILGIFLLCFGVLLLLLSNQWSRRRIAINIAFGLLAFSILAYALAITRHFQENTSHYAILMNSSVAVKSEPSNSSPDLFIIHSGIKLELEREEQDWTEIKLPDGKKGWLKSSYLEKI